MNTLPHLLWHSLHEKCPNTELFLVRIFPHSDWILRISPYSVQMLENTDQKKLCIWTLFTQWLCFLRRKLVLHQAEYTELFISILEDPIIVEILLLNSVRCEAWVWYMWLLGYVPYLLILTLLIIFLCVFRNVSLQVICAWFISGILKFHILYNSIAFCETFASLNAILDKPILSQCSISILPESVRKPLVFLAFWEFIEMKH